MKYAGADVRGRARLGSDIRFKLQSLTSHSGLIVFRHLFFRIGIRERLWERFRHLKSNPIYGHHVVMMLPSCTRSSDIGSCATRTPTGMTK